MPLELEQITDWVERIREQSDDPELSHKMDDDLRNAFIEHVANLMEPRFSDLAAMAREVLKTDQLGLSRWYS